MIENTNVNMCFCLVQFCFLLNFFIITFFVFYGDLLLWVFSCLNHNFYEVHITIFLCRNVFLLYIINII